MNLFFVPHAGSTSMSYMPFRTTLDSYINICPMELAGRGRRMQETRYHDISECARDLFEKYRTAMEEDDYAIFAHSMGTLLAYEMVKLIQADGVCMPKHIFFSGRTAPFLPIDYISNTGHLTDEQILSFMKLCGGIPELLLEHEEFMKMTLDILRDDLLMASQYKEERGAFDLGCDISVLYGENDPLCSTNLESWEECTSGTCTIYTFSGGHFYYQTHKKEVGELISRILREV